MEYDVGISSRKKEKGTGREMGMFQKKKKVKGQWKWQWDAHILKVVKEKKKMCTHLHTPTQLLVAQ